MQAISKYPKDQSWGKYICATKWLIAKSKQATPKQPQDQSWGKYISRHDVAHRQIPAGSPPTDTLTPGFNLGAKNPSSYIPNNKSKKQIKCPKNCACLRIKGIPERN